MMVTDLMVVGGCWMLLHDKKWSRRRDKYHGCTVADDIGGFIQWHSLRMIRGCLQAEFFSRRCAFSCVYRLFTLFGWYVRYITVSSLLDVSSSPVLSWNPALFFCLLAGWPTEQHWIQDTRRANKPWVLATRQLLQFQLRTHEGKPLQLFHLHFVIDFHVCKKHQCQTNHLQEAGPNFHVHYCLFPCSWSLVSSDLAQNSYAIAGRSILWWKNWVESSFG